MFDGDLAALAASIDTLADPVAVFHPPKPGEEVACFACVNGAFERLFGYATRDIIGLTEDLLYTESTTMDNVMHMRDRLRRANRCAASSNCKRERACRSGSR